VRPLDTAPTNAKAFHYGQGVGRIAGGLLVTCLASARALLTGVQSPPPRGAGQGEMAFGEEPGNHGKDGFVGGARSPRPCGKAVR
jgi:hypothetical protein